MDRIILTTPAGDFGRIVTDELDTSGPIPPQDGPTRAIYERLLEEGIEPEPWQEPTATVPTSISDRQFAQVLALDGKITQDEALAWAARGDLPDDLETALQHIPETGGQRFGARMLLSSATTYERDHPLTDTLAGLLGYAPEAVDDLWQRAFAL